MPFTSLCPIRSTASTRNGRRGSAFRSCARSRWPTAERTARRRDTPAGTLANAVQDQDRRSREGPETVSAMLRFPEQRLATFTCGFGEAKVSHYRVVGTKGALFSDPAYASHGDIHQTIVVGDDREEKSFEDR